MYKPSLLLKFLALNAVAAVLVSSGVPVYVMLPLDIVTNQNTLRDPDKTKANLIELKNGGVDGVMGDIWFGLVEQQPRQYNFSAYIDMLQLVRGAGLKFQAVMSFHKCGGNVGDDCNFPLPQWVSDVGNTHDAFYKDREGNVDDEYISLFADESNIFGGRSPIEIYRDYMAAFADTFQEYLGSTITNIEVGLGPAGEMRYPSYPLSRWQFCGVGEFQCYDSYALANLSAAAAAAGHPDWGHAGPDNAGTYDSRPSDTGFFSANGHNNFQSDYGQFFLGWYSQSLIDHGDRVLEAAKSVFGPLNVAISGKVAGIHWWYKDESHAAELTAGYFNTDQRNAYLDISRMFAKHAADFDFTCLEMRDNEQPASCKCGPYELVQQTKAAAHQAGIGYSGENALPRYDQTAYNTIESQSTALGFLIDAFTYLRLGPSLLSGNNWSLFKQFVFKMHSLTG